MNKTIIFDLDGTLLNTLDDLTDSVNNALNSFGYPKRNINEIRSFLGNGARNLIKQSLPKNTSDEIFEQVLAYYKEYYSKHNNLKTEPYEGIINMLSKLKELNYNLAIVSNKPDKDVKLLNQIYFKDYINLAIGENENLGIKKKPAPDSILKVLESFKASKSESFYVGDSEVDIKTSYNANIRGVFCSWGFRTYEQLKNSGASEIVNNANELFDVIINS